MRLRKFLSILEKLNLEALKLDPIGLEYARRVSGLHAFRSAVEDLEEIPAFDEPIRVLKSSRVFATDSDTLELDGQSRDTAMVDAALALYYGAKTLLATLRQAVPGENKAVLSVQIPEPVNIKKLIYVCGKLEKALTGSIVCEQTGGQAAIQLIEPTGSWIEVNVGTESALALAADLIWSAAVVYGKYQEAKVFEEHVRALNIKAESMEDVRKGQSEAIVRLIHSESGSLVERHLGGNGGQLERLKVPIKLMADLIKDGVRFAPPEDSSPSVKEWFPDFSRLGALSPRTGANGVTPAAPAREKEAPAPEEAPDEPAPTGVVAGTAQKTVAAQAEPKPAPEPKAAAEPKPVVEQKTPKAPAIPKGVKLTDTVDLEA